MIYGGVFERHPDLKFIVAHTGSAFIGLIERLDHGFQLFHECREHITQPPSVFARRNLYYDTCAFSKAFIEMAVGEIGEDRFLFGTDYPYIVADPSYIEALDLSDAQKQKIFSGNAARLFSKRLALPRAEAR
jgi:aminocarboxymuconate-semialdehyde decarboxylase